MPQLLETLMVLCFGFSWPMSLVRSWKARSAKGKSLLFLCAIAVGYAAGIAAKLLSGSLNYVLVFYLLNLAMVLADIALYFRNRNFDKEDRHD